MRVTCARSIEYQIIYQHTKHMKLLISAFCATIIASPLSFADKCKKKCDGEKDEATLLADKCKKKCDGEKDEATLLAGKCKKKCDGEKDEATLV